MLSVVFCMLMQATDAPTIFRKSSTADVAAKDSSKNKQSTSALPSTPARCILHTNYGNVYRTQLFMLSECRCMYSVVCVADKCWKWTQVQRVRLILATLLVAVRRHVVFNHTDK